MKGYSLVFTVTAVTLLIVLTGVGIINQKKEYHFFENPLVCSGCHFDKFSRWNVSQHSKAFTGDFFQKQFYDVVLPSMSYDDKVADVHEGCIGCHGPSSFLAGDMIPPETSVMDNHWNKGDGIKTLADRGIFCDFCHTLESFKHEVPFNHDYISSATGEVDAKMADLEFPWSPYHDTKTSPIFEGTEICATCHNEQNPYGVWVKATQIEYLESIYPQRGIICQTCHLQPMGGKPAKMGQIRPTKNTDHWFGGGFAGFVEGAADVNIIPGNMEVSTGEKVLFTVKVQALATGHKFPTGSVEERDVWLHLSINERDGKELYHIPVNANPADPNDKYFITTNAKVAYPSHSKLSEPIVRDALPEGDRLYHSAFIDSEGEFTYAQWFAVKTIDNRFDPLEERIEEYSWTVPAELKGKEVLLTAVLNYKRMPDSMADYLGIQRRPVEKVTRDVFVLKIRP